MAKRSIKLIYCGGDRKQFADIAVNNGWLYGSRLPATIHHPIYFADQDWKNPNKVKYLAELEKYRPVMATVLDLEDENQFEEVIDWAKDVSLIAEQVVIIPKVLGVINKIPELINGKQVILGYSVPTKYGGTTVPLSEFGDRPVHLLGGSPHKQLVLSYYLNVVSTDGNMTMKMAVQRAQFWRKRKGRTGHWVKLWEIGRDKEHNAPYLAFELSMQNVMDMWIQAGFDVPHRYSVVEFGNSQMGNNSRHTSIFPADSI